MKKEYQDAFAPYFKDVSIGPIIGELPLVSILTPYYNNGAYIQDFLDSVLAQSYTNWELLVVDDASPDNLAEKVLLEYGDPRIKFRRLSVNSGGAVARTEAFKMSSGAFVACFDPDDIMHPDYLLALMKKALSTPAPDIVMMDVLCFGASEELWTQQVRTEKELTTRQWIPGVSLVKRKLWEVTGGQSLSPEIRYGSQDWEFWLHCFEKCSPIKVSHVPLPIFLYRRHNTAVSSKSNFYEYRIRRTILKAHSSIFMRYGTGEQFLAEGYAKSFYAYIHSRQWKEVIKILLECQRQLKPVVYLGPLARAVGVPIWGGFKKFCRKYILNPLGIRKLPGSLMRTNS